MTQLTTADLLRPVKLAGYVGQEKMKAQLGVHIAASNIEVKPMAHVLLTGPPGSGKSTLAGLIAGALCEPFMTAEMPLNNEDYRLLRDFRGVLFLDEIHRGSKREQEELLPLLEHGYMRPKNQFRIDIPWLQVIGATTEPSKVIRPLAERFPIRPHFDPYSDTEMTVIVLGMARKLGVDLSDQGCAVIAAASAGVPRMAASLVQAAAAQQTATGRSTTAQAVLSMCRVTAEGLTPEHVDYLLLLRKVGSPVGQIALRNMLDADEGHILELERLLVLKDLVVKSPRGRELTTAGYTRARQLNEEAP